MSRDQKTTSQQNEENDMKINLNFSPPYSQVDNGSVIQKQPKINQPASAPLAVLDDWMSIPQHIPNNCPDGLQYLLTVDQINVIQKVHHSERFFGFEKTNKYTRTIVNNFGQKMFYAVEDTNCFTRNCCGSSREFEMKIVDRLGHEIIHLSRRYACQSCIFPCCLQKIEVYSPPGCLVGTVEQDWSLLTPIFTIRNAVYEKVLKIKGPICQLNTCSCDVEFKVLSKDKTFEVGRISKYWLGLAKECFRDADYFSISFPMDLDVHMKAVMIGAFFLIDFMFFEN